MTSLKNTVAAILVGGKGTRLKSVVFDRPKPLALIDEQPFLHIILKDLVSHGITNVILLTGYQHEKILASCGDGSQFGLKINYSQEFSPLGTAGAVYNARSLLQSHKEFLLLNGDTYLNDSYKDLLESSLEKDVLGFIGVTSGKKEENRFGSLTIEQSTGKIESFQEKSHNLNGLLNAGIYRLSCEILTKIPQDTFCSLEKDIFPKLLQDGKLLKAVLLSGDFFDIGTPESYRSFSKYWRLKHNTE